MANIIASGTTAADSAEFTLAAGDSTVLLLTGTPASDARAVVRIKAADGTFHRAGELTGQYPAQSLTGAGTYKVSKVASSSAYGVDRN